jgi:hypothetical protein
VAPGNATQTHDADFVYLFVQNFEQITIFLTTPMVRRL